MVKDFLNEFYIRHAGIKSECADVLHSICYFLIPGNEMQYFSEYKRKGATSNF